MTNNPLPLQKAILQLDDARSQAAARDVVALCADGILRHQREIGDAINEMLDASVAPPSDDFCEITREMAEGAKKVLVFLDALHEEFSFRYAKWIRRYLAEKIGYLLEAAQEFDDEDSVDEVVESYDHEQWLDQLIRKAATRAPSDN